MARADPAKGGDYLFFPCEAPTISTLPEASQQKGPYRSILKSFSPLIIVIWAKFINRVIKINEPENELLAVLSRRLKWVIGAGTLLYRENLRKLLYSKTG